MKYDHCYYVIEHHYETFKYLDTEQKLHQKSSQVKEPYSWKMLFYSLCFWKLNKYSTYKLIKVDTNHHFKTKQYPKGGYKHAFIAVCACSGLWDSLSHRSFAGLTTQTQVHHNKFDKRPELVYRETQDPRSDTAGIRADMINTAFP